MWFGDKNRVIQNVPRDIAILNVHIINREIYQEKRSEFNQYTLSQWLKEGLDVQQHNQVHSHEQTKTLFLERSCDMEGKNTPGLIEQSVRR